MITETIATGTISVPELTATSGCVVEIGSTNNLLLVLQDTCEGDKTYPVFNQYNRFILDYGQEYVHEKDAEFACGKAKIKTTFLAENNQLSYTIEKEHDFCKDYITSVAQGSVNFDAYARYRVVINNPTNGTVSVKKNGSALSSYQYVTAGDRLTITATAASGCEVESVVFNGKEYSNGTTITIRHEDLSSEYIYVSAKMSSTVNKEFLSSTTTMQHQQTLSLPGLKADRATTISMGEATIRVVATDNSDWWEDSLTMSGSGNHYYGGSNFIDNDLGVNLYVRDDELYLEGWVDSNYSTQYVVESVSLPIYSVKQIVPADEA
ncbi:MAG: hypothetical protein IJ999_06055 [Clostridia bacterium]|nr:hypothetical protein [Clostridia bacterium]